MTPSMSTHSVMWNQGSFIQFPWLV